VHSKNVSLLSHKNKNKFSFRDIVLELLEKSIPLDIKKVKVITSHKYNVLRNLIA